MKLSEPKMITWGIAVALGVVGILGHLLKLPIVSTYSFWLVALAFVILALGTYLKDL